MEAALLYSVIEKVWAIKNVTGKKLVVTQTLSAPL